MEGLEPLFSYAQDENSSLGDDAEVLPPLKVAGLFAGIGGIELGLGASGHEAQVLCEIDEAAQEVLKVRFPGAELVSDVRDMASLPSVELLAGGFPCQDLSQAGKTAGIEGEKSGLVAEVFRLLETTDVKWLLLENVPFMLQLNRGKAMDVLTTWLAEAGFHWAYRIIDTRAFGLPQRRKRVIVLASRTEDPREVLFPPDAEPEEPQDPKAFGFYWTEGERGVGWGIEVVPTLKGGSTIGIPSPPAVWFPDDARFIKPDIRDAERLQGFPEGWTEPALKCGRGGRGARWRLVGNAVSVPVARWVGERLRHPEPYDDEFDAVLNEADSWPTAAWGRGDEIRKAFVSEWPVQTPLRPLSEFIQYPGRTLSARATAGFLKRARRGNLNFQEGFLEALDSHLERMKAEA